MAAVENMETIYTLGNLGNQNLYSRKNTFRLSSLSMHVADITQKFVNTIIFKISNANFLEQ